MSASGGHLSASGEHLSASGGQIFVISYSGGQYFWRTCPRPADFCPRRTFVRGGQFSQTKFTTEFSADFFLADCPRVDGGSDRIRSDPPRTLADFLCPHKVRLSPPESAEKRSSADTGADSGGQWRTQADPIRSAADSGGSDRIRGGLRLHLTRCLRVLRDAAASQLDRHLWSSTNM